MYSTIDDAVKLVIANKVDRATEREVNFDQGAAFAKKVRCHSLHFSGEGCALHCLIISPQQRVRCRRSEMSC